MAFALLDHTEEKTTIDEILTGTFKEKDRQINFAIEELEKIKTEIEEIKILRINPYNNQSEYSVSTKELRELLDNHISKLKGEQE